MPGNPAHRPLRCSASSPRTLSLAALALTASLALSGCMASQHQHAIALANATAPVVDQAAAAYRSANAIHNVFLQYDAYEHFGPGKTPVYRPKDIQPLLSQNDIDARLAVLAALQLYVSNLVAITGDTDTPELQAASKSLGESVAALGNTLAPTVEGAFGVNPPSDPTIAVDTTIISGTATTTTTGSSTAAPAIGAAAQNGISTAVNALGQFLASRKIKKELPAIVINMDKQLKPLWIAMLKDVELLANQEKRDYDSIIADQTGFLLEPSITLDAQARREQVMKLPDIVYRQRDSAQQLGKLKDSIYNLALVHHALAASAQQNNPESLKSKLGELAAAGRDLGQFYSSLSKDTAN